MEMMIIGMNCNLKNQSMLVDRCMINSISVIHSSHRTSTPMQLHSRNIEGNILRFVLNYHNFRRSLHWIKIIQILKVFRQLRTENPDANVEALEKMATERVVKNSKKSRAFYRIQVRMKREEEWSDDYIKATRKLVGSGDITQSKLKKKVCRDYR